MSFEMRPPKSDMPKKQKMIPIPENLAELVYFYASQSGKPTLDQGEGGGNPFASALVELLNYTNISFEEFRIKLIEITLQKSRKYQQPEIISKYKFKRWQFLPKSSGEKRIALIFVFSDYSNTSLPSLLGAVHDLRRISKSLSKAGFSVQTAIDPDDLGLSDILRDFNKRSRQADIALIYTTGHGVEIEGATYLQPSNSVLTNTKKEINEHTISISKLKDVTNAKKSNLIFYGGCRITLL